MPRPEFSSKRPGAPKSRNPFAAWMQKRKEAKEEAAMEAAKMITNDTAKNETAFVDTLASIDFLHSNLPKSVLEAKSDPNRPCGDLEYASRAMQQMILKNPQTVSVDMRKLDEKLLTLAMLFKQAVEQGDERAAFAAKAALVRGLTNIRTRVPEYQPELFRLFVESNEKYLESWITLVGMCQVADRLKENTERQRVMYEDELAKSEASIDALETIIREDPELRTAFTQIMNNDSVEERAKWNDAQRKVHIMMVERRIDKAKLQLKNSLLTQSETELAAKVGQIEILYVKVANVPVIEDPNLLNKYNEQMEQLFNEMAATDVEIDEALKMMDDIEGRLDQLNNAPGAVRAREVATEEAEAALEEIQRRQDIRAGELSDKNNASLRDLGLRTEQEINALRELHQQQEALMEQQAMEEIQQQEETNVLYN